MSEDSKRCGAKCKLSKAKIAILHKSVMRHPQYRYIANDLGLNSTSTVKNYLVSGERYLNRFEDKLYDLFSIYAGEYEDIFNEHYIEYEDLFCMKHDLEDGKIPDKLKPAFDRFMQKSKFEFIEKHVSQDEDKILDSVILSDIPEKDKEIKLYIKFYRVYTRARAFKESTYIEYLDSHANTSKNVGISFKMLEKLNKEDFGETPKEVNVTGGIGVQHYSIIDLAIEEEAKSQIEDNTRLGIPTLYNDNSVIDIPEEDISRELEEIDINLEG